ncbi:hypothetical protein DYB28_001907, partial [Aphanomyces astaci]
MPPPPPVLGQTLTSARNVSEANVHISNPNAVIHISTSRPGKHKPSMVDTYCLLFNAQVRFKLFHVQVDTCIRFTTTQGQLVEHMSHNPASIDGAITQVPRNQYGHDQKFIVALQYVNYGIDVGDVLCEYAYSPHDPSGGLFRNATMVCKIYRDTRQRSHWVFNPIGEGMTCVSHCIVGLTRCAQLHLVDIIPDIDIPNVASLNSIQGICSALSSVEFLAFENKFPANGHDKRAFATCLCEGMVRSRPELRSEKRITALLSLLYEMFDQIGAYGALWYCNVTTVSGVDINGDCQVDWEEFTSFCVALGMISTKQSQLAEGKGKNCFVVSSSDRAITVWSIVNAVKGQYVQSGKVVNHDMMMVVKWCPMLKLCLLSSVKSTSLWNVDTYVVEIPATRLFATCSFDHNVAVWEADRMKVLFQFTGHTQVMLTGHHYALLDVKLVRHHSAKLFCVTGDTSGHFKIWDISRCIVDASRDAAVVLHTYTVNVVGSMAPIFHSFAIIPERKRTTELLDIWAGNFQVLRLVPEMVTSLHSPLQFVLYNQVSHTFTASIAGRITVAPMSACAYSSEHGLIATGDTNGHIRVHDFQRLSLIFRCDGHKGEVTALAFHRQCCVLFAGDSAGEVLVWQVLNVSTMSKCLMRLTSTAATPASSLSSTFVTDVSPTAPTTCGISSLCMTEDSEHSFASVVAADDLGYVHCWPLQSIRQHFRGVMRIHFDPLAESMIAYARGGYNPNL